MFVASLFIYRVADVPSHRFSLKGARRSLAANDQDIFVDRISLGGDDDR